MKRISILILGGIFAWTGGFAQNVAVQSAENYLRNGQLSLAMKSIEPATLDATTSQKAKTWYYRGVIYQTIFEDSTKQSLAPNALELAFGSYEQATQLDNKQEYSDQIKPLLLQLRVDYFNKGIKAVIKNDYANGYLDFSHSLAVFNYLNAHYGVKDVDTLSMIYAAYAALQTDKLDTAKMLYLKLIDYKYNTTGRYNNMPRNAYIDLATLYQKQKDTTSAVATLKKGEQVVPNDTVLLITDLNYAFAQKNFAQAVNILKIVIALEPNNARLYYNMGIAYEKLKDAPNAETAYKKAVELDPKNPDAQYSLGAWYFNQGVQLDKQKQDLPLSEQKKYDDLGKQSDAMFQKALPELEKANQMKPNDLETLRALSTLYTITKQDDKAAAIKKQMDSLTGK